jgi:hypothetical protein
MFIITDCQSYVNCIPPRAQTTPGLDSRQMLPLFLPWCLRVLVVNRKFGTHHKGTKTPRKQNLSGTAGSLGRQDDVLPEIKRVHLPGSIARFVEPRTASVFRKKRTPTKTRKRQRLSMARLALTSTRFCSRRSLRRMPPGCVQDDFRRGYSAENPSTCPREAMRVSPGASCQSRAETPHANTWSRRLVARKELRPFSLLPLSIGFPQHANLRRTRIFIMHWGVGRRSELRALVGGGDSVHASSARFR